MQQQKRALAPCAAAFFPADGHSDPSCDNGALLYPGEDEESDHDSYLAGRAACASSARAKDAATSRALSATTPRPTDGALAARAPTRTDSPTLHQVRSHLVHWGGGDGSGRWVGRMGTTSPQSGWCFVEVSISGQRRMCQTRIGVHAQPGLSSLMKTGCGALCRTSFFGKGAASFKEPGPAVFASGGFGTDFTLNSMLATFRPDLCTFPLPTVSTALVMRSRWTGAASLHAPCAGQDSVSRQISSKSTCC